MTNSEQSEQQHFRYRHYLPPAERKLPSGWRDRIEQQADVTPEPGTAYVTIHYPGVRRGWLALLGADKTGPHVDAFEADTFAAATRWAFERTQHVYMAEPDGGATLLSPPPASPDTPTV